MYSSQPQRRLLKVLSLTPSRSDGLALPLPPPVPVSSSLSLPRLPPPDQQQHLFSRRSTVLWMVILMIVVVTLLLLLSLPSTSLTLLPFPTIVPTTFTTLPSSLLCCCSSSNTGSVFPTTLFADAASLSPVITSAVYNSADDTITSLSPTTLQVNTMLNNAALGGYQESKFTTIRLTFSNMLRIQLPDVVQWSTIFIPVHILLEDSISGVDGSGGWPALYVSVEGVLAFGSSIIIRGGYFNYTKTFFRIPTPGGLLLTNSSTLIIETGTYQAQNTNPASSSTLFFNMLTDLSVLDGSGVFIINNNFSGSALAAGGGNWGWYLLQFSSGKFTVNTSSTFTLSNNNMVVSDITLGYIYCEVFYLNSVPISLSSNSTLSIYNNTMSTFNMSCSNTLIWRVAFLIATSLYLETGSTFSISENVISVLDVYAGNKWMWYAIHTNSLVSAKTSSTFQISGNVMNANIVSGPHTRSWFVVSFESGYATFTNSSVLDVSRNVLLATNTTSLIWYWAVFSIGYSFPLTLQNESAAIFSNNNMIALNGSSAPTWSWRMFVLTAISQINISSDCTMSVNNNLIQRQLQWGEVSAFPAAVNLLYVEMSSTIEVFGRLELRRNTVDLDTGSTSIVSLMWFDATVVLRGGGEGPSSLEVDRNVIIANTGAVFNVSGVSDPAVILPRIHTCLNFVNGDLCKITAGSGTGGGGSQQKYSCAFSLNTYIEGNITECTGTGTNTFTPTKPSTFTQPTTHTQPASHSQTPAATRTALPSPSDAPSHSPTIAATQTAATPSPSPTNTPSLISPTRTLSLPTISPTLSQMTPTSTSTPTASKSDISPSQMSSTPSSSRSHATPSLPSLSTSGTVHSHTHTDDSSTLSTSLSNPMSLSQLPLCPSSPPPCPYAGAALLGNISSNNNNNLLNITAISSSNTSSSSSQCAPSGGGGGGLAVQVPYSVWGDGQPFHISILLVNSLMEFFDTGFATTFSTTLMMMMVTTTFEGVLVSQQSPHPSQLQLVNNNSSNGGGGGGGKLWIVSTLTYTGPTSRSARKIDVTISLSSDSFSCRTINPVLQIPVSVSLAAAPAIPVVISTVVDVAVGISVVVPSALVRAGMMKTLVGMLRCDEFDPSDEVGFISNPFGWAAGREELQYFRGSVMTALILMCVVAMLMALVVVAVKMCNAGDDSSISSSGSKSSSSTTIITTTTTNTTSWSDAVKKLRLPSLPLVIVLLLSEVCVASAISMLFYTNSVATDIVLSLATLFPLFVYMGVYIYQTAVSSRYVTIEKTPDDEKQQQQKEDADTDKFTDSNVKDDGDAGSQHRQQQQHPRRSLISRVVHYLLEPTHDVVILERRPQNMEDEGSDDDDDEENQNRRRRKQPQQPRSANNWLRHNFYFVAERRWAMYGALEVVGGTLMNILEGIPLSTTSRTLCVARPACVMIIAAILLILLVWKIPNAVRLQQWCSIFVMGGIVITSALATANALSPSQSVELATGYIGAIVMGAAAILGVVEVVVLLLAYLPAIRDVLSLRSRSLQSVLLRSIRCTENKKMNSTHDGDDDPLQVPMLPMSVEGGGGGGGRDTPPLLLRRLDSSDLDNPTTTTTTPRSPVTREGSNSSSSSDEFQTSSWQQSHQHIVTPEELRAQEALINMQILAELEEFERSEQEITQKHQHQNSFTRR